MAVNQPRKKQSLRNNEYYNTQELFDDLYERSQHGEIFMHLMELIASETPDRAAMATVGRSGRVKPPVRKIAAMYEIGYKIFIPMQFAV